MMDEIEEIRARNAGRFDPGTADVDRLLAIIAEKDRQAAALLKHAADTIEQKANVIAEKDAEIARLSGRARCGCDACCLEDME